MKSKGGKKTLKIFLQNTDKQIESIINWRMRTYEKEKAVKNAEIESIINWRMRTYQKEKTDKSAGQFSTQHKQTN